MVYYGSKKPPLGGRTEIDMKKRICSLVALFLLCALALTSFASCGNSDPVYVRIDVKDYGVMVAELYPDVAPITVDNFVKLVKQGYYTDVIFHRVIENFMIQGGIGKTYASTIKGEFAANGVENNLSHTRGVLSMARTDYFNSASSQFFICHVDYTGLDGNYAAFGKLLSGYEVLDAIAAVDTHTKYWQGAVMQNMPVVDVVISSIVLCDKNGTPLS